MSDPNLDFVKAVLHFDGTDEPTTITDVTGREWTVGGPTAAAPPLQEGRWYNVRSIHKDGKLIAHSIALCDDQSD